LNFPLIAIKNIPAESNTGTKSQPLMKGGKPHLSLHQQTNLFVVCTLAHLSIARIYV